MNKREAKKLTENKMGNRKCKKVENCPDCEIGPCIQHQYFPSFKPIEKRVLQAIIHKTRINVPQTAARDMQIEESQCEAPLANIASYAGNSAERVVKAIRTLARRGLIEKKPGKNHPFYTAICESLLLYPDVKKPWTVPGRMRRYRTRMKELALENKLLSEKIQSLQIERAI
jgi:hypothetical protein